MAIRKSIGDRPRRKLTANFEQAERYVANFTKEKPMLVSQVIYDEMKADPKFASLMDKVKPTKPIPR